MKDLLERLDILMMILNNMHENEQIKSKHYRELVDQVERLREMVSNLYGNETNIS